MWERPQCRDRRCDTEVPPRIRAEFEAVNPRTLRRFNSSTIPGRSPLVANPMFQFPDAQGGEQ
jgi:hypothetical protein